jgi:hypothetical protein
MAIFFQIYSVNRLLQLPTPGVSALKILSISSGSTAVAGEGVTARVSRYPVFREQGEFLYVLGGCDLL